MRPTVFLDSGIFIALMNERDQWHSQALALFGGPRPRWMTSLLVVSETYSWFLHRYGEESARGFRLLLEQLDGLSLLEVDRDHHAACVAMLERFRGSRLTYVDASSLVFASLRRVRQIWSTDHHLGLTGVEILPRS
ncbi:MAG: PIN domain-containing protein [Planctomycetaceae bacterium]